jgi:hypothetical protein
MQQGTDIISEVYCETKNLRMAIQKKGVGCWRKV